MELVLDKTNILEIESPFLFREAISSINSSIEQDNGYWIFSDEDEILKKSLNVQIVQSIFMLDFNNRKIQKVLMEDLYNLALDEENYMQTQTLLSNLEEYALRLEWQLLYDIQVEKVDIRNLLKSMISGIIVPDNILEQLNEYIKIIARMLQGKVLVLVDVLGCFETDEWKQIEKTAQYEGIYILCIEHTTNYQGGNRIVIDSDGCRVI